MGSRVKTRDRGLRRFLSTLSSMRSQLVVGLLEPEARQRRGNTNLLTVALTHEMGSPRQGIPARSFVAGTFDENRGRYENDLEKAVTNSLFRRRPFRAELEDQGREVLGDMRGRIDAGIAPAEKLEADSTDDPVPVRETGELRDSLRFEVRGRR